MFSFSDLKKNLKKDYTGFKPLKLAVLGDSSTQFLVQAIKGMCYHYEIKPEIFEADFNQIERQVFDLSSELYEFCPEVVLVFKSSEKFLSKFYKTKPDDRNSYADHEIATANSIYETLTQRLQCKVLYYNLGYINDSVFGNYANKTKQSFIYQLRRFNYELMHLAQEAKNLFVVDVNLLQSHTGRNNMFAANIYINTDSVFSIDFLPLVAKQTLDVITAIQGKVKKCVIVDLDNTMWGGIIGDDGMENIQIGSLGIGKAFTEFQYWLKSLKERGIILAVCSKNTESVAMQVFTDHPDMILRPGDIAVFVANWDNKVDNIKYIQSVLNIGFDSMVFLDDNPFERNMVREHLPMVTVPELPEDPAEYLEFLYTQNLFETASYIADDQNRTEQYQVEAKRTAAQKSFTDESSFLKSLNMISDVQPFNKFNTPRVAQLSQRSNQFNLRTVRYTEADIERLAGDDRYATFSFTLEDKFGDNGLICAVILYKENAATLFIDTWFMSCRVLKRGMEQFVLNTLVNYARDNGFKQLKGEYIATLKNDMVREHYRKLGFTEENEYWYLDIATYQQKEYFIATKNTLAK